VNCIISDNTVFRIQKLVNRPISRGFEKAISEILDDYEKIKKSKRRADH